MKRIILLAIYTMLLGTMACEDESSELGDQYFNKGKYDEAVAEYSKYLELQPNNVKSLYNRGRAYEEIGDYSNAMEDFKKVLKIDPRNVSAHLSVGQDFYRNGDYASAIFYYDKAVKLDPSSAQAHYLIARSNHKLGKFRDALNGYNNAININKDFGDAYLSRGAIKVYMRQMKGACSDFRTAKALDVQEADKAISQYCK
ncbi:tetratricopeptide repeat protein [Fulvivirgaceae bacterium BMA10]|uniref:Tetratricopeptide repeat protein n=1 Tax=Splendidivirga corallicola TaxID=3051826 RepID=A0ABT8KZ08_9BACT|nr:tetratricopeptide repeat protein [Fulvivirgaceae bacterium BMA10]